MSLASADIAPGTLLAGKYRVEKQLGRGGMGVVLSARHVQLDQRVAVKLMLPEALASTEAVARFLREARAAARITSDHVVRVFDVGTLETGEPFMAMEYLEGTDLGQQIASRGALPVEEAVAYVLEACEAIAEAHAVGVIHRDLKPSNLFLAKKRDGRSILKVLDFGISKVSQAGGASDGAATRTAALMGSPLYMSPEQMMSSRDVDARSDIWALGVVLYEALTGTLPYTGETLPQICMAVMQTAAEPPQSRNPALPAGLGDVVLRCMQKSPAERYASVGELADALGPFSRGAVASVERIRHTLSAPSSTGVPSLADAEPARTAPVDAATAPRGAGTNANWGETHAGREQPKRVPWALVAGAAVAVVSAALWFGVSRVGGETASSAEPAPEAMSAAPPAIAEPKLPPAPSVTAAASVAESDPPSPPPAEASASAAVASAAPPSTSRPVRTAPRTTATARTQPAIKTTTPQKTERAPAPDLGKPGERSRL